VPLNDLRPLRILHLEDEDDDAELVLRALSRDGLSHQITRVDTRAAFIAALQNAAPDVVIADYGLRGYNGGTALQDLLQHTPQIPCVFVSGTIGEEALVEILKAGATDYLLKGNLTRLSSAVKRAYGEAQERAARDDAERRLREQAALLDNAQEAIIVEDLERHITYWNKGAERLYGYTSGEVVGREGSTVYVGSPRELAEARAAVASDGTWAGVLHQRTRAGKEIAVRSHRTLLRDDSGAAHSMLVVNTDITEAHSLEAKFLRMQRLESLGFLVSGIAHDLNNVFSPMVIATHVLQGKVTDERGKRMLEVLDASAVRATDLVRQMLTFARGTEGERLPLQPRQIVGELRKMMQESLPKSITIETEVADDVWNITADPTQVQQVLLNLCVNARDAMPAGGTVVLKATNTTLDASYVSMRPDTRPGPYVIFSVKDNGTGIPPEVAGKIFEPFFTTKEEGKGTGLGLSTVAGIVKSHGGFVDVETVQDVGTTFRTYFPARPSTHTDASRPAAVAAAASAGSGETVLFVDDEDAIRDVTREALEGCGYQVLTAADGAEAVAQYAMHRTEIAVVVTDMDMPVMDGASTIRALCRMDAGARVVGMSGLRANETLAVAAGAVGFLAKPYTVTELVAVLAHAIHPAP
jgi:two-component system, cell cycle sensor histidine kinase and response regulator CckA